MKNENENANRTLTRSSPTARDLAKSRERVIHQRVPPCRCVCIFFSFFHFSFFIFHFSSSTLQVTHGGPAGDAGRLLHAPANRVRCCLCRGGSDCGQRDVSFQSVGREGDHL